MLRLHLVADMTEIGEGDQRHAVAELNGPLDAALNQPPLVVERGVERAPCILCVVFDLVRISAVEQPSLAIQRLRPFAQREIGPTMIVSPEVPAFPRTSGPPAAGACTTLRDTIDSS